MKMIKNNIWTILSLALVVLFATTGGAMAQYTNPVGDQTIEGIAITKATNVFVAARNIMFVIGGFGLIAVAFLAITGKVNWKMVGSIAIGLGIIAAASAVISYAISDEGEGTTSFSPNQYGDTLGK